MRKECCSGMMDELERKSLNTFELNDFKANRNGFLLKPGIKAEPCPPPLCGLRDTREKTLPGARSIAVQENTAESRRKRGGQLLLVAQLQPARPIWADWANPPQLPAPRTGGAGRAAGKTHCFLNTVAKVFHLRVVEIVVQASKTDCKLFRAAPSVCSPLRTEEFYFVTGLLRHCCSKAG